MEYFIHYGANQAGLGPSQEVIQKFSGLYDMSQFSTLIAAGVKNDEYNENIIDLYVQPWTNYSIYFKKWEQGHSRALIVEFLRGDSTLDYIDSISVTYNSSGFSNFVPPQDCHMIRVYAQSVDPFTDVDIVRIFAPGASNTPARYTYPMFELEGGMELKGGDYLSEDGIVRASVFDYVFLNRDVNTMNIACTRVGTNTAGFIVAHRKANPNEYPGGYSNRIVCSYLPSINESQMTEDVEGICIYPTAQADFYYMSIHKTLLAKYGTTDTAANCLTAFIALIQSGEYNDWAISFGTSDVLSVENYTMKQEYDYKRMKNAKTFADRSYYNAIGVEEEGYGAILDISAYKNTFLYDELTNILKNYLGDIDFTLQQITGYYTDGDTVRY